jgi:hypothetical protein
MWADRNVGRTLLSVAFDFDFAFAFDFAFDFAFAFAFAFDFDLAFAFDLNRPKEPHFAKECPSKQNQKSKATDRSVRPTQILWSSDRHH